MKKLLTILLISVSLQASESTSVQRYDSIIFDIGGVLLQGSAKTLVTELKECSAATQQKLIEAAASQAWKDWDKGLITKWQLIDLLQEGVDKAILEEFVELFLSPKRPLIDECITIIKILKEHGYKLYILSNFSVDAHNALAQNHPELLEQFDGAVFSHQIKCIKPDSAIYQHLLDTYELDSTRSAFIDDSDANVIAAETHGIKGIHFIPGRLFNALCDQEILKK